MRKSLVAVVLFVALASCGYSRQYYPAHEPVPGRSYSYSVTPPNDLWFRNSFNEDSGIDRAFNRKSSNMWVHVDVEPNSPMHPVNLRAELEATAHRLLANPHDEVREPDEFLLSSGTPSVAREDCSRPRFTLPVITPELCVLQVAIAREEVFLHFVGVAPNEEGARAELAVFARSLSFD